MMTYEKELELIAHKLVAMLKAQQFNEIAERHGYTLCFNRDVSLAIRDDFNAAVNECIGSMEASLLKIRLRKFISNKVDISYVVECDLQFEQSSGVLVELIVNTNGNHQLEHISSYRKAYHS